MRIAVDTVLISVLFGGDISSVECLLIQFVYSKLQSL